MIRRGMGGGGGIITVGGLAAVLAAVLVLEYHAARREDATLPFSVRHSPAAVPGHPGLPTSDGRAQLAEMLARPLFAPSRRPPPDPGGPAGSPAAALPRLTGVMVSRGDRRVIFAASGDGKLIVLGEGGRIGPYLVQSIGDGQATILGPDGAHVLRPTYATRTEAGASPPNQEAGALATGQSILDLLRNGPKPPFVGVPGLSGSAAASGAPR